LTEEIIKKPETGRISNPIKQVYKEQEALPESTLSIAKTTQA